MGSWRERARLVREWNTWRSPPLAHPPARRNVLVKELRDLPRQQLAKVGTRKAQADAQL